MSDDFKLSERAWFHSEMEKTLLIEDVKEFIKRLKEQLINFYGKDCGWCKEIDKLSGELG